MMASKRHKRKTSCAGKIRFNSREECIAFLKRKPPESNIRLSVYHCEFCGGYHFGHLDHNQYIHMLKRRGEYDEK